SAPRGALRRRADRPSSRRPRRHHRGRNHRVPVRRVQLRGSAASGTSCDGPLLRSAGLGMDDEAGHVQGLRLAPFRREVSAGLPPRPRSIASRLMPRAAVDFVLGLHSHLPYVLNHGRWPHGSDWICEAAIDTYLPLIEKMRALDEANIAAPVTIGFTPILANQLEHPTFAKELDDYFHQRLEFCDEAPESLESTGDQHLLPLVDYWRTRLVRL